MTSNEIIVAVGIINTLLGFLAGRASKAKFSVENKATDYIVDIEVHPGKQKLVIKRITPKKDSE
jgi:hypothetical protein